MEDGRLSTLSMRDFRTIKRLLRPTDHLPLLEIARIVGVNVRFVMAIDKKTHPYCKGKFPPGIETIRCCNCGFEVVNDYCLVCELKRLKRLGELKRVYNTELMAEGALDLDLLEEDKERQCRVRREKQREREEKMINNCKFCGEEISDEETHTTSKKGKLK